MNKKVTVLACLLFFSVLTYAQEISKNALGIRIGDDDGFGAEISYQRALKSNNRLELDLGFRNSNNIDAIKLAGLYQWLWEIDKRFNWYIGVGGGIASFRYDFDNENDDNRRGRSNSSTSIFAAGDIGIEYNFKIPLLVSLDFRPEIGLGDLSRDLGFDIALGIRYQFK